MSPMGITIALDDDVSRLLECEAQRQEKSFEQVASEALHRGLTSTESIPRRTRYWVIPHHAELQAGIGHGGFNQLVDELEGEAAVARTARR